MPEITNGNIQNKPTDKQVKTRSLFPLSYPFFQTHRFGDITPHFVLDVVPDDKNVEFRSIGETRSYTLGAPLMQDIYVKKDYFMIDKRAILPTAADLIFTNPSIGDDIDASIAGTSVDGFPNRVGSLMVKLWSMVIDTTYTGWAEDYNLEALLYFCLVGEYFYSQGSLLSNLGCHFSNCFSVIDDEGSKRSFDDWEDHVFENLRSLLHLNYSSMTLMVTIDGEQIAVLADDVDASAYTAGKKVTLRQAIQMMRDNMAFKINIYGTPPQYIAQLAWNDWQNPTWFYNLDYPIDLFRCFAYQISCFHYYTNDKVDPVYSAELYRQLISHYIFGVFSSANAFTYNLNGLRYRYDWCSAFYFRSLLSDFVSSSSPNITTTYRTFLFPYLRAIFGYHRSLRYQDYFTGSRTRPLAIGNTSVSVSGNAVSVLDVTQKIQAQRFFNAVNRTRRQISEYVKGIFGVESPAPDFHDPQWLAHTEDVVYGSEVENTGAAQQSKPNSVTSVLRGQSNKYAFSVDVDYQSVIIGVTYYDIQRMYTDFIERPYFHVNRFDYFNPYMQYIGDQPIYLAEFDPRTPNLAGYFGYQLRHMEYKQRFAQCAGGFAQYLPGYAFLADDEHTTFFSDPNPSESQCSDFIRSWPFELDKFYVSLTGYSPASYFHFIVKNINECNASRPMAFAPSIL